MEKKKFIPTIGTGYFYHPVSNELLATFAYSLSQSISITTQNLAIEGGKNHKLLYNHYFGRRMEVTIDSATFKPEFLALSVGDNFGADVADMKRTEVITLDGSGEATLSETPSSAFLVEIYNPNLDAYTSVEATGDDIAYATWANEKVRVSYFTSVSVSKLQIGDLAPTTVRTVLTSDVYGQAGGVVQRLQFTIPQLQISGEFDLDFSSSDAVVSSISGMATFDDEYETYCTLDIEEVDGGMSGFSRIDGVFADTMVDALEIPSPGTNTDYDIIVYGIRNMIYGNTIITEDCTFTIDGSAGITIVNETVTVASTVTAGDSAVVTATYTVSGVDYTCSLVIDIVSV